MKGILLRGTALTALCIASPALAAEVEYVGPAVGKWSDGANWNTGNQPQAGDTVRVWHNDPVVPRTVIYDSVLNPALGHVTVQGSFGAPLTLQQESGALTVGGLTIGGNTRGVYTLGGTGALNVGGDVELGVFSAANSFSQSGLATAQIGGDLRIGLVAGSSGSYSMAGGTTVIGGGINVAEAGVATLNQSGGSLSASLLAIASYVNSNGQVSLSGGSLQISGTTYIGMGSGSIAQSGGVHSTGTLNFGGIAGSSGTYYLSGGNLNVADLTQLGSVGFGSVIQSGGSHTAATLVLGNTATGSGSYVMSDGQLTLNGQGISLGDAGTGSFQQSSGAVSLLGAQGNLQIGRLAGSTGTYQMSGGTLDIGSLLVVGRAGSGQFIQSGSSSVTVDTGLSVGALAGGNGTYQLNGGTLLVKGNEAIGNAGTGTFSQGGGTHTVSSSLTIGPNGTYNLGNGTLSAANITNNGTLSHTGTGTVNGPVTNNGSVKVHGAQATYNGTFTNRGAYEHDPGYISATSRFANLNVETTGYLKGGPSPYYRDQFIVVGDFHNASTQAATWDTLGSTLSFSGAGVHLLQLAGADLGAVASGYNANFAFGGFFVGAGMTIMLEDGNADPGAAFYVGGFGLENFDLALLANIESDFNIYYDSSLAENAYLGGQNYALNGDGWLIAVDRNTPPPPPPPHGSGFQTGQPGTEVSEPTTILLLGGGLVGLAALGRRRKAA